MNEVSIALLVAGCGALFFVGHLLEEVFRRWRIPDVLPLVLIGALAGPVFGWLQVAPDGTPLRLFAHIALILILFHGGYELRAEDLRTGALHAVSRAMLLMILSGGAAGLIAWSVAGLSPALSALFALAVAPVAATVAIPMLEHLGLGRAVRSAITIETALGDVISLVAVLALTGVLTGKGAGVGPAIGGFVSSLLLASALGLGCALAWSLILGRIQTLAKTAFATEAALLLVAGTASWLGYSDAIAALAFGFALQNLDLLPAPFLARRRLSPTGLSDLEQRLLAEAVFIVKVFYFLLLGAQLRFGDANLWIAAAAGVLAIGLVRQLWYRLLPDKTTPRHDRAVAAWMIPRGLATAVAAGIPAAAGIAGAEPLRALAYAFIPLSVLVTALGVATAGKPPAAGTDGITPQSSPGP